MQGMKILYRRTMSTSAPGLTPFAPANARRVPRYSGLAGIYLSNGRSISLGLGHQATIDRRSLVGNPVPGIVLQNVPLCPLTQTLPFVWLGKDPGQLIE